MSVGPEPVDLPVLEPNVWVDDTNSGVRVPVSSEGNAGHTNEGYSVDNENNSIADDIAAKLVAILVDGFKKREGRGPTEIELDELLAELTEERINSMLGMGGNEEGGEAENGQELGHELSGEDDNGVDEEHDAADEDLQPEIASDCGNIDQDCITGNKRKSIFESDIADVNTAVDEASEHKSKSASTCAANSSGFSFSWPSQTPVVGLSNEEEDDDNNNEDVVPCQSEPVLSNGVRPQAFTFTWPASA